MRLKNIMAALLVALGSPATAEPCLTLDEIDANLDARFMAGSVRGCIETERYEDAIRMFFAYSNFSLYDQQRVWDESAHVAVQELHVWIFSGYSIDQMNALKAVVGRLREPDSKLFRDTCIAVSSAGPPNYRPTYMIKRGMMPRKTDDDWLTEGFDSQAAWQKALIEINGCAEDTFG